MNINLKICETCQKFQCTIERCCQLVKEDLIMVNHLLVVQCNGKTLSAEPFGKTKMEMVNKNEAIGLGAKSVSKHELPKHMRRCLDNAITRTANDLERIELPSGCKYMTEQLMSRWNESGQ